MEYRGQGVRKWAVGEKYMKKENNKKEDTTKDAIKNLEHYLKIIYEKDINKYIDNQ